MEIQVINEDEKLIIRPIGKISSETASQFEKALKENVNENIKNLILDFKNIDLITSAGLRVLLTYQKLMNKQGDLTVINVNELIKDVFELTGFINILNIEEVVS